MNLPTTRKEAFQKNSPHYFTGELCKHGHLAKRRTSKASCVMCDKMHGAKKMTIKEAVNAGLERFWPHTECRNGHLSPRRTSKNACTACDKMNGHIRRARMLHATVAWEDKDAIKGLYESTPGFALDHIVPLQGKTVCGLHCSDNLIKIPTSINGSKSNRWDSKLASDLATLGLDEETIKYMKLDQAW